jgi:hypothetical protein
MTTPERLARGGTRVPKIGHVWQIKISLKTGMADRRFASVIDSTRLFASPAVSPKTQLLRVEEPLGRRFYITRKIHAEGRMIVFYRFLSFPTFAMNFRVGRIYKR